MKYVDFFKKYEKYYEAVDIEFAWFLNCQVTREDEKVLVAAMTLSQLLNKGHVCLNIAEIAGGQLWPRLANENANEFNDNLNNNENVKLRFPELSDWQDCLRKSNLVGNTDDNRPLILHAGVRLYLHRYWHYENELYHCIQARLVNKPIESIALNQIQKCIANWEWDINAETDWQQIGVTLAMLQKFMVISGGPGTGKTRTIARIILLLTEQAINSGNQIKIALAASTGKAAARMLESVQREMRSLSLSLQIRQALPQECFTLHRLLGYLPGKVSFRHNRQNPLAYDCVIVDETSMADLALLAKLFMATPTNSRIVLVGDKDQLVSVETGTVFGDICGKNKCSEFSATMRQRLQEASGIALPVKDPDSKSSQSLEPSLISDAVVVLQKNYRFQIKSGIGDLAEAIKQGDAEQAIDILHSPQLHNVSLVSLPTPDQMKDAFKPWICRGFDAYLKQETISGMFKNFANFTILSPFRRGPYGTLALNDLAEEVLHENGLLPTIRQNKLYHKCPIMVRYNDYNLRLFNGDIGILFRSEKKSMEEVIYKNISSEKENKLLIYFPDNDQQSTGKISPDSFEYRMLPPAIIAHWERVYAMTIHKSQGSEYQELLLVLPDQQTGNYNEIMTRELLYTGVTRARERVTIMASEKLLRQIILRPVNRSSGLMDRLWLSYLP